MDLLSLTIFQKTYEVDFHRQQLRMSLNMKVVSNMMTVTYLTIAATARVLLMVQLLLPLSESFLIVSRTTNHGAIPATTITSAGSTTLLPRAYLTSALKDKAAPNVSGEELEKMLNEWDKPLVVDAYATW